MSDGDRPIALKKKRARRKLQAPNDDMRARIFDAAAELVAEGGFPNLRIEDLAQRAGISVGTFYLYFESKDDLFVQIVIGYTDRLLERFHRAGEAGGTVAERLARRFDTYLDFVQENREGFLYFRDSGAVDTTRGRLSGWALQVHANELRPLLEEGMESGEIRRMDGHLLAHAITGLFQHMVGLWLENPQTISRERVRTFLDDLVVFGTAPARRSSDE